MIGPRLKLAREAAGRSLRDLEGAISRLVSAQAIGKYERNEMMPTSTVLLALAAALRVSPEYLLSEGLIELVEVDFRRTPESGVKEAKAVQSSVLDHVERYLKLEELLNLPSAGWSKPKGEAYSAASREAADLVAAQIRSDWGLGSDAIMDLTELLEEHGVKVLARELPVGVFGSKALVRRSGKQDVAAIVVNSLHTGERQRLTLAHELSHLVLTPFAGVDEEAAANRFAGAFLVPEGTLKAKLGDHRTSVSLGELVSLKRYFRVSLQVLVVRLHQCGIVSRAEYSRAWAMLKGHGYLDPPWKEPEAVEPEKPRRMMRLCLRAVTEDALSESKAAEFLQISVHELNRRLQAEHLN